VRVLKQQAQEYANINEFLRGSISDELAHAREQAALIDAQAAAAKVARQALREQQIQQQRANAALQQSAETQSAKENDQKPSESTKAKKVVKPIVDEEGFKGKETYLKKGKELQKVIATEDNAPKAPKKDEATTNIETNPYAAARLEGAYRSASDEQTSATLKNVKRRELAQERKSRQELQTPPAQPDQQAQKVEKAAQPKGQPAQVQQKTAQQAQKSQQPHTKAQPPQKGQQAQQQQKDKPAVQKGQTQKGQQTAQKAPQPKQPAPVQQKSPQPTKKAQKAPQPDSQQKAQKAPTQKPNQNKASGKKSTGQAKAPAQQQVPASDDTGFSPALIAGAVLGLLAVGFMFFTSV